MSLRIFHIIFIVACVALSAFVAVWGFRTYAMEHDRSAFALGAFFAFVGVALVAYGVRAYGKLKEL
jgi:uncharacterized membrane protein YidH (DUF202 family)